MDRIQKYNVIKYYWERGLLYICWSRRRNLLKGHISRCFLGVKKLAWQRSVDSEAPLPPVRSDYSAFVKHREGWRSGSWWRRERAKDIMLKR